MQALRQFFLLKGKTLCSNANSQENTNEKWLNNNAVYYSEALNFLQAQKCNAHLCHHHAMEESLYEPIPSQND